MLVVDASIAVKWYLSEEDTPQAIALFRQPFKLVAPPIIHLEVLSVLTKAARKNKLEMAYTQTLINRWNSLLAQKALFLPEPEPGHQQAVSLSFTTGHTFYDCLYLSLAKHLHAPLATADTRQQTIARSLGIEIFGWQSTA